MVKYLLNNVQCEFEMVNIIPSFLHSFPNTNPWRIPLDPPGPTGYNRPSLPQLSTGWRRRPGTSSLGSCGDSSKVIFTYLN